MSRWQEKIVEKSADTFVGIDVSKHKLDICILPHGLVSQVENSVKAIRGLIREFHKHGVQLIAMEATGKYHRLAHSMLHEAGLSVTIVNPFRSRQFADSLGKLAKSDVIDAEALARFAQRMEPEITVPAEKTLQELHDLHIARRQVCDEVADLKRQLQTTDHPIAKRQIKARMSLGMCHKEALEVAIFDLIKSTPDLRSKFEILTSVPNIGKITAAIMLADLSELGEANAKEIASLAGVAPMNWDSGTKSGKRIIRGGRRTVRNALYMCAVSAISRSDPFGQSYRRLIQRGKNPKVALTAVMRKLVVVANTLISENRHWQPNRIAA
ncbi:IS110 family transposase [Shimia sp. R11_0]|uniref:IS110 family transposase n=1 Tax=Shimia sp. R11_0 TaxID=2821096 RepID=UPI001ADA88CF|nr:IS110 family transposase [Shimia sp. R11_0]MBO9477223.1 IS110 family transposase [Shimia sp. R11_0]